MKNALLPLFFAAFAILPMAAAVAQTQVPAETAEASKGTKATHPDRAIQRIRTEDAGSRIDELRVGGETEKITVQPKTDVPAYEVKPAEGARGNAPAAASGDTNGSRVWNVLKF